jgi:hypothetical protein
LQASSRYEHPSLSKFAFAFSCFGLQDPKTLVPLAIKKTTKLDLDQIANLIHPFPLVCQMEWNGRAQRRVGKRSGSEPKYWLSRLFSLAVNQRRFPPPWSVEEEACFVVRGRRVTFAGRDLARPIHDNGNQPLIWINNTERCDAISSARLGEWRRKRFWSVQMTTLKTLTIVAALLAGGTSLAMAQNGPATGGERPVAGGANGGGWGGGWYGGGWYGAPAYGYGYGYGYRPYRPLYGYYGPYHRYRYRHY